MKFYENELLAVPGIYMNGIYSGVKKSRKDLGIIYTAKGVAAGVFTQNIMKAAPVVISSSHLLNDVTKAILVNSGCANACTGEIGMSNAMRCIDALSQHLELSPEEVLIASTGIIGQQLDMDKIERALPHLCHGLTDLSLFDFPESITTTDSYNKICSYVFELEGVPITISGISKGSGMIHPNMATMLGFIQTDAKVNKKMLQKIISDVVVNTFNMISVDGDTSTNDMVLLLSSGEAKHTCIREDSEGYKQLYEGIYKVCEYLAIAIAKDGEGATKLIECRVKNAQSQSDARLMAKSVVKSSLVKAAVFGSDANWGRVICSLGYSGADFDPNKTTLSLKGQSQTVILMDQGIGLAFDTLKAVEILNEAKVIIEVDVKSGSFAAKAWGCDLTYDYVKINAEYTT